MDVSLGIELLHNQNLELKGWGNTHFPNAALVVMISMEWMASHSYGRTLMGHSTVQESGFREYTACYVPHPHGVSAPSWLFSCAAKGTAHLFRLTTLGWCKWVIGLCSLGSLTDCHSSSKWVRVKLNGILEAFGWWCLLSPYGQERQTHSPNSCPILVQMKLCPFLNDVFKLLGSLLKDWYHSKNSLQADFYCWKVVSSHCQ